VAECGDAGDPIVHRHPDSPVARAYQALARTVMDELKHGEPPPHLPELNL
jgi:ATP-binding protein involved in chromosome partitioning